MQMLDLERHLKSKTYEATFLIDYQQNIEKLFIQSREKTKEEVNKDLVKS